MKGSKHILFISSWYPHPHDPTHGIFNRHFAEAAALHHRVSVLHVLSDSLIEQDLKIESQTVDGIFTIWVHYKKVKSAIPFFAQWLKRKRMLNAYNVGYDLLVKQTTRPDLIQLNVAMPAGIGVLNLARKHKLPFVLNEGWTGYMSADASYNGFLLKWLTGKIVSAAKVIMPVSQSLEQAMRSQGLSGNYRIVPNVVNTEQFGLVEALEHKPFKLLHISTLDQRQKNVLGIIRAFDRALESNPDIQLTLVGDGKDRQQLEEEVLRRRLRGKVRFTGVMLKEEIVREIQSHDALVMFSNYESFCVVIAEAMACGKPVISSRCGGLTELIDAELGYTIAPSDEAALSQAMLNLHMNYAKFEPKHIRKFVTDRFTQQQVAEKLNAVYQSVLS